MDVQVTHRNAMCVIAHPIPLAPLASFQAIRVRNAIAVPKKESSYIAKLLGLYDEKS